MRRPKDRIARQTVLVTDIEMNQMTVIVVIVIVMIMIVVVVTREVVVKRKRKRKGERERGKSVNGKTVKETKEDVEEEEEGVEVKRRVGHPMRSLPHN